MFHCSSNLTADAPVAPSYNMLHIRDIDTRLPLDVQVIFSSFRFDGRANSHSLGFPTKDEDMALSVPPPWSESHMTSIIARMNVVKLAEKIVSTYNYRYLSIRFFP